MIEKLPTRERELFEALYARGEGTAAELQASLDDPPSNSAVRMMLSRMEKKGFITHREVNNRFVYSPSVSQPKVRKSAINRFVQTYFGGSPVGAAVALIGMSERVSPEELDQLEDLISKVRREELS